MDKLNLLPCPMPDCGSDLVGTGRLPCGVETVCCGRCGISVPATDEASAVERWNRRASSSASKELPPLPEARAIVARQAFPRVYALAYTADMMQEYARQAIAADRRARQGEPVNEDTERAAFETAMPAAYPRCRNMPDKSYNSPQLHERWIGWMARAAITAAAPADAAAHDAAALMWQEALSQAGFYVAGHCENGEHHAEIIMGMPMPKLTVRAPAEDAREQQPDERTAFEAWYMDPNRKGSTFGYQNTREGLHIAFRALSEAAWMERARRAAPKKAAGEQNARAVVPAGWKLVPVEPTEAMMDAAESCSSDWPRTTWKAAFAAMLAAAPSCAAPKEGGEA